jgi:amidohydrolase
VAACGHRGIPASVTDAESPMNIHPTILADHALLSAWRQDLHRHPELGYEEHRTAAFVAQELATLGLEVHTAIGRTGVVGTLRRGSSDRAIGLRADMDALAMQELGDIPHRSVDAGKFHGCGHDGHTIMLLGAARALARHGRFDGTVHFIFQPAEEGGAGGAAMIADGLFERFPVSAVFGMHNDPMLPIGHFGMQSGPMMAAAQMFEVAVHGRGGHAAFPHTTVDPVLTAAQIVVALQGIVSRNVDPMATAVLSVTRTSGGEAFNVIPAKATLGGTLRYFLHEVGELLRARITAVARGIATGNGGDAEVAFLPNGFPPLVNTPEETALAARVAATLVGSEAVNAAVTPSMGAEDFAFMLQARPGCYVLIGQGGERGGCMVHHPEYDFNDAIIPLGASYWVALAEEALASAR